MESAFQPPPPVGWHRDDEVELVKKVTIIDLTSQEMAQPNGQLLIMLVFHSNHEFLKQAVIIADRNRLLEPQIEPPANRAAIAERVVPQDDGTAFLATIGWLDAQVLPTLVTPMKFK